MTGGADVPALTRFLHRHSPRLIEIASAASSHLFGDKPIVRFLKGVHAKFDLVVDKACRRPSLPGEDVFWWFITTLGDLAETTAPRPGIPTSA